MYNPFSTNIQSVERDRSGNWFYEMFSSSSNVSSFKSERHKLNTVLSNPAALKVFKLQCDMVSLGRVHAINQNGKEKQNDSLKKKLEYPNYFQTDSQFLWTYMFWRMLGTAYLTTSSKLLKDSTQLYFLNPTNFIWTDKLLKRLDKIVLSDKSFREVKDLTVEYKNIDGTSSTYKLGEVMPFFDLTNGLGNWYKGNSSLDALYDIISNSKSAIKAKGSNLDFSGKFMVFGKNSMDNINEVPMDESEKVDVKSKLKGGESVHVIKTPIDIKRFVENLNKLVLDEAYFSDYYKIGAMYGIPRDVLEASLNGSTYENQKWSKGSWIEQSISPACDDFTNGIERLFGYDNGNVRLKISFDHLSFMQVFKTQEQEAISKQLNNLNIAHNMGAIEEEDLKQRVKILIGDE